MATLCRWEVFEGRPGRRLVGQEEGEIPRYQRSPKVFLTGGMGHTSVLDPSSSRNVTPVSSIGLSVPRAGSKYVLSFGTFTTKSWFEAGSCKRVTLLKTSHSCVRPQPGIVR